MSRQRKVAGHAAIRVAPLSSPTETPGVHSGSSDKTARSKSDSELESVYDGRLVYIASPYDEGNFSSFSGQFAGLGIQSHKVHVSSGKNLMKQLKILSSNKTLADERYLIVCITANIHREYISMKDDRTPLLISDALALFSEQRCPYMRGKPKIFLIQCPDQGSLRDLHQEPLSDILSQHWSQKMGNDFLAVVSRNHSLLEHFWSNLCALSPALDVASIIHKTADSCDKTRRTVEVYSQLRKSLKLGKMKMVTDIVRDSQGDSRPSHQSFSQPPAVRNNEPEPPRNILVTSRDQRASTGSYDQHPRHGATHSHEQHPFENIYGALYGNCVGDAIGLLTEFMSKHEARKHYGSHRELEYCHKVVDRHRRHWAEGDWTDDSDQMLLIMDSIVHNYGQIIAEDFAERMICWADHGFPELGDKGGCGIGRTTLKVMRHPDFLHIPHNAAHQVWENSGRSFAPNGAVMRTSVLGVYQYTDLTAVKDNTLEICRTTHADPRCQASCVAVTTAIAMMLQRMHWDGKYYNVTAIIEDSFRHASHVLKGTGYEDEMYQHMLCTRLDDLDLENREKMGYTFKTLGAGFWALRQDDFRQALQAIVRQGGDADTNGAVAGALLGCKLGYRNIPRSWLEKLCHKTWLDAKITKFCEWLPRLPSRLS